MSQQQQNPTDQTSNFFWLLLIIAGALLAVWYFKREWYVIPIYYFRYYELSLFQWIAQGWDYLANAVPILHLPKSSLTDFVQMKQYILGSNPTHVKWEDFSNLNTTVGGWFKWFALPCLIVLGLLTYFKFGGRKFSRIYSMKTLRDADQENWPEITPVMSLDLVKQDIEKGPWAMAQTPLDFCKAHEMISVTVVKERTVWKLDRSEATRILTAQMGPVWTGIQDIPIYMKALAVIFIARATRERDVASRFLSQIARSASGGKLDFEGVEEQIRKYANTEAVQWLQMRHAYVYTVMASMLEIARSDGVLATAEFLWLKPVDRRLWYILNSVGRQTSVVEVAGPFAHWLTEKKLKRSLRTPMIQEAVKALEESMLDTLYVQKGDSWHTLNAA